MCVSRAACFLCRYSPLDLEDSSDNYYKIDFEGYNSTTSINTTIIRSNAMLIGTPLPPILETAEDSSAVSSYSNSYTQAV